jgi:uncharacterized membrane protein
MNIKQFFAAYGLAAVVFLVLDGIWLTIMASRIYRPAIGDIMADSFNLAPAVAFYVIYLVGVVVFAVMPGLERQSAMVSLGYGALLGLVAYATYDLTNQAVLKSWPVGLTLADLTWGTFVTAVASAAATALHLRWVGNAD